MAGLLAPSAAFSHAALIEAETAQAIRLHAYYDTGTPMADAQVIIYAPDRPAVPWGQGNTDSEGRFTFIPDTVEGRWSVQVRQAGHGAMAHIELHGETATVLAPTVAAGSWVQRAVMVALVAWGALGTALFVLRRKGRPDASA
ncbi:MAG: carboxypeptidase regulatory-like domain-containing protein [Rhodobacteraceae bacterium]|nr:carboxypeptidase regulatory-like domain-containing protein [Paracoccaceae bacterium]